MEFIAKTIDLNTTFEKGPQLCLCVHSDDMEKMVASYPITYMVEPTKEYNSFEGRRYHSNTIYHPFYINVDGKKYRVICLVSKNAESFDGEILDKENLFWCDPKALHSYSRRQHIPIMDHLFEERSSVIMSEIQIKRLVYRIL